jgi:hypothetical protein
MGNYQVIGNDVKGVLRSKAGGVKLRRRCGVFWLGRR